MQVVGGTLGEVLFSTDFHQDENWDELGLVRLVLTEIPVIVSESAPKANMIFKRNREVLAIPETVKQCVLFFSRA